MLFLAFYSLFYFLWLPKKDKYVKKFICTKLLVVFSVNLLFVPFVYSGKRKFAHNCGYSKRNSGKYYAKENKFKRRRKKEQRVKKQKQSRKLEKLKHNGGLDRFCLRIVRKLKKTPGLACKLGLEGTNGKALKKFVRLALLGYLAKETSARVVCETRREDESEKVEWCCADSLLMYECWEKITKKMPTLSCDDIKTLLQEAGQDPVCSSFCNSDIVFSFEEIMKASQNKTNVSITLDREKKLTLPAAYMLGSVTTMALVAVAIIIFCSLYYVTRKRAQEGEFDVCVESDRGVVSFTDEVAVVLSTSSETESETSGAQTSDTGDSGTSETQTSDISDACESDSSFCILKK